MNRVSQITVNLKLGNCVLITIHDSRFIDVTFNNSVRFPLQPGTTNNSDEGVPLAMAATVTESTLSDAASPTAAIPKRITNAQTVCNEKNEKGKLCNGHLKQLRTAGESADMHLRGDDVLSKCHTCGTLYMGPPLGHVRDPQKQQRFVEAELTALLQAAGGTLPVVKQNEKGVFVIVEPEGAATVGPVKTASPAAKPAVTGTAGVSPAPATAKAPAAKPPEAAKQPKVGAAPNRQLFKRSTYLGVVDSGPVAGETFEQKCERLKKVSAAAKQRADEGGAQSAEAPAIATDAVEAAGPASTPDHSPDTPVATGSTAAEPAVAAPQAAAAAKSGQADRTLMKRYTYCGVVDTGPVPGETFEQKVERLRAVSAAAKQRADEGGAGH